MYQQCSSKIITISLGLQYTNNVITKLSTTVYKYNKKTGTSHYVINKCEQIHRVNIRKTPITTPQCPQDCGKILNDWTLSASTRDIVCNYLELLKLKYFRLQLEFLQETVKVWVIMVLTVEVLALMPSSTLAVVKKKKMFEKLFQIQILKLFFNFVKLNFHFLCWMFNIW